MVLESWRQEKVFRSKIKVSPMCIGDAGRGYRLMAGLGREEGEGEMTGENAQKYTVIIHRNTQTVKLAA